MGDDLRPGDQCRGLPARYYYSDLPFAALYGRAGYGLVTPRGRLLHRRRRREGFRTSPSSTPPSSVRTRASPATSIPTATSAWARRSCRTSSTRSWSHRSTGAACCSSTTTSGAASSTTSSRATSRTTGRTRHLIWTTASPASGSPACACRPFSRKGGVNHMKITHESILKLITYRFGLGHLNKRHHFASNIGSSLDFEHPRTSLPNASRPADGRRHACAKPATAATAAARPKPHDMAKLRSSGLLERYGYEARSAELRPGLPSAGHHPPGAARELTTRAAPGGGVESMSAGLSRRRFVAGIAVPARRGAGRRSAGRERHGEDRTRGAGGSARPVAHELARRAGAVSARPAADPLLQLHPHLSPRAGAEVDRPLPRGARRRPLHLRGDELVRARAGGRLGGGLLPGHRSRPHRPHGLDHDGPRARLPDVPAAGRRRGAHHRARPLLDARVAAAPGRGGRRERAQGAPVPAAHSRARHRRRSGRRPAPRHRPAHAARRDHVGALQLWCEAAGAIDRGRDRRRERASPTRAADDAGRGRRPRPGGRGVRGGRARVRRVRRRVSQVAVGTARDRPRLGKAGGVVAHEPGHPVLRPEGLWRLDRGRHGERARGTHDDPGRLSLLRAPLGARRRRSPSTRRSAPSASPGARSR